MGEKLMEHTVRIEESLCIGCGACVADCPASNIELAGEPRAAKVFDPENCLFCGHCEAICPAGAVTLTGFEEVPAEIPEEVNGAVRLDPDTLLDAIRTRRSIRHFKDDPVPQEIIAKIIEAGRLTQTAKNSQRQSYAVLRERLAEAEKIGVEGLRAVMVAEAAKAAAAGKDPVAVSPLGRTQITDDFLFFGAPLAIVVLSPSKTDGCLAAENMALMAEACGLGVLFSGFFTDIANAAPALREMLGIDESRQAVATLVLGWPDIRYRRTVRREPARVTWL
jgi:nitroreductase/NAD-dependent dihydropyrimidine dehydrogenase PreA subunit